MPSDHRDAAVLGLAAATPAAFPFFENTTVFDPPTNWTDRSTSYGRSLMLTHSSGNGTALLSTFTFRPPGAPYLPIYQSLNGGLSWKQISTVNFVNASQPGAWIAQPYLFELPEQVGDYPAGTVLLAGNAVPNSFTSTNIEVHASTDAGRSWKYVSTVVSSGPPNTTNGAPCVWEPFIYLYDGQIIVYYSDQSDPKYGQKLAHKTSLDLKAWGPVVNDVTFSNSTLRPGMATVARIQNGSYMISYELGFANVDPVKAPYAVHYQIADTPLVFNQAPKNLLKSTDGTIPSSCPFTIWTPAGGNNGTIVLSDGTYSELFLNTQNGDPAAWQKVSSGHGVGYTRSLMVTPNDDVVLVYNGGMYGEAITEVTNGDFAVPSPSYISEVKQDSSQ